MKILMVLVLPLLIVTSTACDADVKKVCENFLEVCSTELEGFTQAECEVEINNEIDDGLTQEQLNCAADADTCINADICI